VNFRGFRAAPNDLRQQPPMIDEFGIDEQRETGFGTGLRAHLGYGRLEGPEIQAEPEAPAELEPVEWQGDPEPIPEILGLEQRARELDALAAQLAEREQQLRDLEAELAQEAQQLAAADAVRTAERRPVREVLREHAEQYAEQLVLTFEQALDATAPDGGPDFATRLTALRLLLAEAYGEPSPGRPAEGTSAVEDELAELRRRRGLA
jgi:hypothetical protein